MNPRESHAISRTIEKSVDGVRFDRTPSGRVKSWGFDGTGFATFGDKRLFFREKDGEVRISAWPDSDVPFAGPQKTYGAKATVANGESLAGTYIRLFGELKLPFVG